MERTTCQASMVAYLPYPSAESNVIGGRSQEQDMEVAYLNSRVGTGQGRHAS